MCPHAVHWGVFNSLRKGCGVRIIRVGAKMTMLWLRVVAKHEREKSYFSCFRILQTLCVPKLNRLLDGAFHCQPS